MNLNTVTSVRRPTSMDEIGPWRPGNAWLAGGTWLFSEPQPTVDTLLDLDALGWQPLSASAAGLEIAATCRIAELNRFEAPATWTAAPLLRDCCDALLASWKIWNAATVGGNICMSLPAGAMIALTVALEATYELWPRDADPREVPAAAFVTGNHANVLHAGELLRSIFMPATALSKRYAMRHSSLVKLGRSAALLIGTRSRFGDEFRLTITAATPWPVHLRFDRTPSAGELRQAIDEHIAADGYFVDPNGSAAYKRHLTYFHAEQIRAELALPEAAA